MYYCYNLKTDWSNFKKVYADKMLYQLLKIPVCISDNAYLISNY